MGVGMSVGSTGGLAQMQHWVHVGWKQPPQHLHRARQCSEALHALLLASVPLSAQEPGDPPYCVSTAPLAITQGLATTLCQKGFRTLHHALHPCGQGLLWEPQSDHFLYLDRPHRALCCAEPDPTYSILAPQILPLNNPRCVTHYRQNSLLFGLSLTE